MLRRLWDVIQFCIFLLEFLTDHPDLILQTKDRKLFKKAKGLKVVFVDESAAVVIEALRQLASKEF